MTLSWNSVPVSYDPSIFMLHYKWTNHRTIHSTETHGSGRVQYNCKQWPARILSVLFILVKSSQKQFSPKVPSRSSFSIIHNFLPNHGRILPGLTFNGSEPLNVNTGRILPGFGRKLRIVEKLVPLNVNPGRILP